MQDKVTLKKYQIHHHQVSQDNTASPMFNNIYDNFTKQ